jgi:AMP-binding enzyme
LLEVKSSEVCCAARRDGLRTAPDRYRATRQTFAELDEAVNRTAAAISGRGVGQDDRTAPLHSHNSHEFVVVVALAMAKLRVMMVPINFMLGPDKIAYTLNRSGVSGLIVEDELLPVDEAALTGVRTLVPHEPPLATVLPDREEALAVTEDIHETYQRDGLGPAMAKFIAFTSLRDRLRPTSRTALDPADVGLPAEDDGSRDHPLLGPHMVWVSRYEPDFDSLRGASTRIVVAGGAESEGTFPYRAAPAVAQQLGTEAVISPSHHGGFGQQGDPDAFAATLRRVLTDVG